MGGTGTTLRRLTVVSVGGKQNSWARAAEREYCQRLTAWDARVITVKAGYGPRAVEQERTRLLAQVPAGTMVVATRVGPGSPTTARFTKRLQTWMASGGVSFIIGGPQGLDADLLERADVVLSLSSLTFAHDVARVALLEQCYRGWTILTGHPYHRP